jgi:hypothetical protein
LQLTDPLFQAVRDREVSVDDRIEQRVEQDADVGSEFAVVEMPAPLDLRDRKRWRVVDRDEVTRAGEDRHLVNDEVIPRPRGGVHDQKQIVRIRLDLRPFVRRLRVFDCERMQIEFPTQNFEVVRRRIHEIEPDEILVALERLADLVEILDDGVPLAVAKLDAVGRRARTRFRRLDRSRLHGA